MPARIPAKSGFPSPSIQSSASALVAGEKVTVGAAAERAERRAAEVKNMKKNRWNMVFLSFWFGLLVVVMVVGRGGGLYIYAALVGGRLSV